MIWLFRQRGKRTGLEASVIQDAFADSEWDGKMHTLRKRIKDLGDDAYLEAFERLAAEYKAS